MEYRRGRRRRSRTPPPPLRPHDRSTRISKTLVSFGGYAERRPRGLMVNNGAFMLQNLMDSWARGEGYSRDQVLEAAQIHMFHEDRCSLRFEITQVQGDTRIKVNPRRGSGCLGDRGEEEPRRSRRSRRTRPKDEIVSDFEDEPPPRDETPPRQSIEEKLDVPLEELIGEPRGDCSASSREPFGSSRRPPQEDRSGSRAAPSAPKIKRPPVKAPMSIDKAPMKSPPVAIPPTTRSKPPVAIPSTTTSSEGHKGMDVDSRAEKIEKDEQDELDSEVEGFEEDDDEKPSGPPGEHWEQCDDNGEPWWSYDGPKGRWACLRPGDEVTRY